MRYLLVVLALAACSPLDMSDPPIYVTQNPVCLLMCIPQIGTMREQTIGHGSGSVTGGASTLSQTSQVSGAASGSVSK